MHVCTCISHLHQAHHPLLVQHSLFCRHVHVHQSPLPMGKQLLQFAQCCDRGKSVWGAGFWDRVVVPEEGHVDEVYAWRVADS